MAININELLNSSRVFFSRAISSLKLRWIVLTKSKKCPYCFANTIPGRSRQSGRGSTVPTCSACGHDLPIDFYYCDSQIITLIGGTDTGKSHFITVLLEQLLSNGNLLEALQMHARLIDNHARHEHQIRWNRLRRKQETLSKTDPNDVTVASLRFVVRLERKQKVIFLSFTDTAGEEFNNIETILETHPHIGNADAMLFLINPLNIEGLFEELTDLPQYEGFFNTPSNSVFKTDYEISSNIYETLGRLRKVKLPNKIKLPVAFCLSKIDMLEPITSIYSPEDITSELLTIKDIIDEANYTSKDLEDFLRERDNRLLMNIESKYAKTAFFPVSPLGKMPQGEFIPNGPEPSGMLHPLVWLLNQLKFV